MDEFHLFDLTKEDSIADYLDNKGQSILSDLFAPQIVGRAYDYYNDDTLFDIYFEPGLVTARIAGSQLYNVYLKRLGDQIRGSCDCPYDARCKHIGALLLYLIEEAEAEELAVLDQPASEEEAPAAKWGIIDQYLDTLSHSDLKKLLKKHAPTHFFDGIRMQFADQQTQQRVLLEVKKSIQRLFTRELYDISEFEANVMDALDRLRSIWLVLPQDVTELLVFLISSVSESFEQGYLYEDYTDHAYDGEEVADYMADFVISLPATEQDLALPRLWTAITDNHFTAFHTFFLTLVEQASPQQLSPLIKIIIKNRLLPKVPGINAQYIYAHIESALKKKQQRKLLKQMKGHSHHFTLLWAQLLEREKKSDKAAKVLDKAIKEVVEQGRNWIVFSGNPNGIFQKRLELASQYQEGKVMKKLARQYLRVLPMADSLAYILELLPKQAEHFEAVLKKENLGQYTAYLEQQQRLSEVVDLFKQHPIQLGVGLYQYPFFQRHKHLFPEQAKQVFKIVLEEALPQAKKRSYYEVAEVLRHLRPLLPDDAFADLIRNITQTYYRRRNLLEILRQGGLMA